VDVDPGQLGKNIVPDLGICADAKLTLEATLEEIRRRSIKPAPAKMAVAQLRTRLERKTGYDDIPIKPQRVFKEINEFFDDETVFVTCIGLHQIWFGQLQKVSRPRHYLECGGAGPLGWDLPASIGAKVARPDKTVVQVVGDYGFQFCMEELPVAVMYNVPFVCIVLNNGYLGLIRQAQKYNFDMDFEVQTWYESVAEGASLAAPMMAGGGRKGAVEAVDSAKGRIEQENQGRGFDFVKFAEACGATGERVTDPKEIRGAFQRAVTSGRPYVIDIIIERNTDASMGTSIDAVKEFE
jgi:tartronate-semialdehyde synthase